MADTSSAAADVKARAVQALADLDLPTPDDVAARLVELDCQGGRRTESYCPVALYLARIDTTWVAEVLEAEAYIWFGADELTPPVRVDVPEVISWFLQRFDAGAYPALVADWATEKVVA